jgi:hypothetical protein
MTKSRACLVLCILVCLFADKPAQAQQKKIGGVWFFGQDGFDTTAILKGLPFHRGDLVSIAEQDRAPWKQGVMAAIRRLTGKDATDVARLCCDEAGDLLVYIGLPGKSVKSITYNETPSGNSRLPEEVLRLYMDIDQGLLKALLAGKGGEDDSQGYALAKNDQELRTKQLQFRDYVLRDQQLFFDVAQTSSDATHRAVAVDGLGYATVTAQQVRALARASFDAEVSAQPFVDLLSSGTFTDRNKGSFLLVTLTKSRDPQLLNMLRSEALTPLEQISEWPTGHAFGARLILGRIAGIDEETLVQLAAQNSPEAILRELQKRR